MLYKVLVVDDEEPVRDLLSRLLIKEQCAVKSVPGAEEALELIKSDDFDVVLLDIMLAGMSGLEALKKIKEIKPSLIVIMITGFGYGFDEALVAKTRELGSSGYIGKNLPTSQIISNFMLFVKTAKEKINKVPEA